MKSSKDREVCRSSLNQGILEKGTLGKWIFSSILVLQSLQAVANTNSAGAGASGGVKSQWENEFKGHLKSELEFIAKTFGSFYAPRKWKESSFGWDLQQEKLKAMAAVDKAQSTYDYRRAVADFLNSTRDYHVGFSFNTDETANLPFMIRTLGGATYVIDVDPNKLSPYLNELMVGSQILEIDGVPIQEVMQSLKGEIGSNVLETDQALADISFSFRRASRGAKVPRGPVMIKFQNQPGQEKIVQLVWDYKAPSIPDWTPQLQNAPHSSTGSSPQLKLDLPQMTSILAESFSGTKPYMLGARRSFVGDFGKSRLWSSPPDSTYDAYMYRNPEGKIIGVVRIPNYTPELGGDRAAADFSQIVAHFETHTDGMIIDQLNNPGGSLFLVYSLASMLTEQALFLPKNRVALTPATVAQCAQILKLSDLITNDAMARLLYGPSIEGYPITYNFHLMTKNYCEFVISEYKQQKQISDPTWIWGMDRINPYPGPRYTKSIVVMVNELDFSGGDWFPSILQDNKRAKIVGVRTAGAGGYIAQMSFPSSFGLNRIVFTGSLAERVDSSPIENLGVQPDIPIPMTAMDYFSGFAPYKSKVRQVLNSLLK